MRVCVEPHDGCGQNTAGRSLCAVCDLGARRITRSAGHAFFIQDIAYKNFASVRCLFHADRFNAGARCSGAGVVFADVRALSSENGLASLDSSSGDGYSQDMIGLLIAALIVVALCAGRRVVGSVKIRRE